ncbi:DUF4112 domain-containing protein [Tessaracoccus sp. MC1865]|uniref:DUF4112 domain-containing protein n=1 Tax=Tessaracoccus sp. MC1865 TaxID=2760310 RepID=UPI0016045530|nr:DUF4112 domain-containing protein [Tessaracoccus sp. MC1865]MBB1483766.1 DUF4112 domain-containing protein [Tessaracoccus sp. MC1865]QTO36835.1 DUF4112 domain-containing protein [Tessaracoccus sp. MC1865]
MTQEPPPTPASAIERARKVAEEALSGSTTDPKLKAARDRTKRDLGNVPKESPAKLTRALSYVLDDLVQVPGTKIRIGVDPVLSIVPWAGTAVGAVFGGSILVDAIRLRAPIPVIGRMAFNSLLDWLLGMIPFVGAIFDAAYRSNKKNLKLLNGAIENRELVKQSSVRYWIAVGALVAVLLLVVITIPILLILGLADLAAAR